MTNSKQDTDPGGSGRGSLRQGTRRLLAATLVIVACWAWLAEAPPAAAQKPHAVATAEIVKDSPPARPLVSGGEPLKYIVDGTTAYIVSDEAISGMALLNSLTPEQHSKALISTKLINLVLGPGHDGQTLQTEGLRASALTVQQKARLRGVIEARLGKLSVAQLAEIHKNLNRTWFAWYGTSDQLAGGNFRVAAPTTIVGFVPPARDGRYPDPTQHAHNMDRDPISEFGAAWVTSR